MGLNEKILDAATGMAQHLSMGLVKGVEVQITLPEAMFAEYAQGLNTRPGESIEFRVHGTKFLVWRAVP